jgi:hypothetical protein
MMKKLALFLLVAIVTNSLVAQNDQPWDVDDTLTIQINRRVITIAGDSISTSKSKRIFTNSFYAWQGLEFKSSGYFTDDNFGINNDPDNRHMELDYARSFQINLNMVDYNVSTKRGHILLTTGLGFKFNRYAFKNTTTTLSFNDDMIFPIVDSAQNFSKNFFNQTYLRAPLLLTYWSQPENPNAFHFSAGVNANYRIGSRIKQNYDLNGKTQRIRNRGHFHLNPFQFDATVRVGFGEVALVATYGLNSLFERDKGPNYLPFGVGLAWNF